MTTEAQAERMRALAERQAGRRGIAAAAGTAQTPVPTTPQPAATATSRRPAKGQTSRSVVVGAAVVAVAGLVTIMDLTERPIETGAPIASVPAMTIVIRHTAGTTGIAGTAATGATQTSAPATTPSSPTLITADTPLTPEPVAITPEPVTVAATNRPQPVTRTNASR